MKRHVRSIAIIHDSHVQDLCSGSSLGLSTDKLAQRLEAARLYKTDHLPLFAHHVLTLDLLYVTQNPVLDGALCLCITLGLIARLGCTLDSLLENRRWTCDSESHPRTGDGNRLMRNQGLHGVECLRFGIASRHDAGPHGLGLVLGGALAVDRRGGAACNGRGIVLSALAAELIKSLFDHARRVDSLALGVDQLARDNVNDLGVDSLQLSVSLLFSHLQLALVQNLQDNVVQGHLSKGLLQVSRGGSLTFGDVKKDVWDLEDIVKVGFDTRTPFEDFVLVACDFEALLAW
jgi:hypothetical protein